MNITGRRGSRIFQRLLVFNLVTVIVISIVPQFVFYSYFKSMYDVELKGLNMQTVRQFQHAVDEPIVKEIVNFPNVYLSELESNEELVYPLTHNISKNSSAILKVSRRTDDIKNNMPYIHSIDLYYPLGNLLFVGDRICMLNESECNLGAQADWFFKFKDSDINIDWISARQSGPFDSSQVATYVRSIPYFGTKEARQGVVAVNVELSELNELLRNMKSLTEGRLLIVDGQGGIIAHNQEEPPFSDDDRPPFINKLLAMEDTGMFDIKLDGEASVISFIQSDYNNWRYISITSVESMYQKSDRLRGWVIAVGGAFLTINVLISVWLTKRAHKPISFRMANLQQSLERNLPIVRHNFILGLLFGSVQEEQLSNEYEEIMGSGHEHRWICSFALHIDRGSGYSLQDITAADFHLIESLEADHSLADICAIKDERSQILGIISYGEEDQLEEVIQRVAAIIGDHASERHVLCIGGSYPSSNGNIAKSFAEARESSLYAFLQPQANVILFDELNLSKLKDTGNAVKALDEMASCIRSRDEKRLQLIIGDVLRELRSGNYTIQYCRNLLHDIVSTISKAVQSMGYSSSEIFGGDIRQQYRNIEHIDKFESWLLAHLHVAIERINERKQQIDPHFADKVISFIHDNIYNQLSLDMVADYVNVSPTYLSKIFKQITNSNFSEFVTELRLEQAALLLREKKLTVQDISSKVGYQSTHHFIRLFKEKHGLTPKQYQKTWTDESPKPD
jgi:two-component system response regulator YesN